jgi:hypothetical protein
MNLLPTLRSRRKLAPWKALIAVLALVSMGCETTRQIAGHGHDLLENPGRSALVRGPAAVGAAAGYTAGIVIAFFMWPAAFFKTSYVRNASQGDIWISPLLASFDYGSGTGAALLGEPFNLFRKAFAEEPPPFPPGHVPETPENHPAEPDPELDFSTGPPAPVSGQDGEG